MRQSSLAAAIAAVAIALALPAYAQAPAVPAVPPTEFRVGYVALAVDPRYDEDYAYNMIPVRPLGRPYPGAELGIADAVQIGQAINVNFSLSQPPRSADARSACTNRRSKGRAASISRACGLTREASWRSRSPPA